jgi:TonB family protein
MMTIAWKSTAILIAAFCAAACLKRRPAALRHFVWTVAFAALLLLPCLPAARPGSILLAAVVTVPSMEAARAVPGPSPQIPWLTILYAAGAILAASRFLAGALRTSWIVRRAAPSPFGAGVVTSAHAPMPLAWGLIRRVIVLPETAAGWPPDRVRAGLLHESMHHRRCDLLTQAFAQIACCLYWCNPLAWLALSRQRAERELACDNAVLRQGITAHDYAGHLVEVARAIAAARRRWSDAPAMAESSGLESRVRALLDRNVNRGPVTRAAAIAVIVAAVALLAPVATLEVHAQGSGEIVGVVRDPSGGVVPNCRVTVRNTNGPNEEVANANAAGEYRLASIPPGEYTLEFASAGFALARMSTTLVAGATARVDAWLNIGQARESVTVRGRRTGSAPAPQTAAAPQRIRVGGNVQPMRLLRQVPAAYPPELQLAGVEGTVLVRAVISKEGAVTGPRVINSVDSRLAQAALDAVKQWQYSPTLLNGQPVETLTTISIEFELEK